MRAARSRPLKVTEGSLAWLYFSPEVNRQAIEASVEEPIAAPYEAMADLIGGKRKCCGSFCGNPRKVKDYLQIRKASKIIQIT